MRRLWGPLGWMTLHSISALYPDEPTANDKTNLKDFMNLFKATIVCPHCQAHFDEMFGLYTKQHPEWLNSKLDFFVFVCRAHNTVNKRLDKPIIRTIEDCITTLKNNTINTTSAEYRKKYIDYISASWYRDRNDATIFQISNCNKLRKIINDYWDKLPQEISISYSSDIDVEQYIGKITPPEIPAGYLSHHNLKFLNKSSKELVFNETTNYTPREASQSEVYVYRKTTFKRQGGKLKLVGI